MTLTNTGDYTGGAIGYTVGKVSKITGSVNITGKQYVGAVVGRTTGIIDDCKMSNINIQGTNYVGGITGHSINSIITCEIQGTISCTGNYVGGIVGYTTSIIENCIYSGNLTSTVDYIGGIAGYTADRVTSSNSSAKVKGRNYVGGVIRIHIFK
ncbi:The GLUG motif protein [compost metagenome]